MTSTYLNPEAWRGRTNGGIPYRLVERSGYSERSESVWTEIYLIPAASLVAFVRESFPLPVQVNGIWTWNNRLMPGTPNMRTRRVTWSTHVDGKPVDPWLNDPLAPPGTYHPVMRVIIDYDNKQKEHDPDDPTAFQEISCNVSGEYLTLSPSGGKWQEGNDIVISATTSLNSSTAPDSPVTLLVPLTEWTLSFPRLDQQSFNSIYFPRLQAATGCVNSQAYSIINSNPPETIMFLGFSMKQDDITILPGETAIDEAENVGGIEPIKDYRLKFTPVNLELKFLEKRITVGQGATAVIYGHNHYWSQESGNWTRLLIDGERPAYRNYNFNDFFTPAEE